MEFDDESVDFEALLRGEIADPIDVAAMASIAYDVLADAKAEVHQRTAIVIKETDAEMQLHTIWEENGAGLGKNLIVGIGRAASSEHAFQVCFDFNNQAVNPLWSFPEELEDGIKVLKDMLDGDERRIHEFASYLILYLQRLEMGINELPVPDPDLAVRPVEMAKRLVGDSEDGRAIKQQNYTTPLVNDRAITITKQTLLGIPESFWTVAEDEPTAEQRLWASQPRLRIRLTEESGMVMREFLTLQDGRYGVATGFCINGDTFDLEGDDVEDEDKTYDQVWTGDLGILTDALMESRVTKELNTAPSPSREAWAYPELPFAFTIAPGASVAEIVQAAMRSLETTITYFLPESCPDGFPAQPNYQYNERKLNRIHSYLTHKISSSLTEATERRHKIVDVVTAAEALLDKLALENHPVAQMVATLHYDYGDVFETALIQSVATEVVMLTHWEEIRAILADQSNRWRKFGAILQTESVEV